MRYEDKVFWSIIGVTILSYFSFMFFYSREVFLNFVTGFTATTLGILIGFSLDRYRELWKRQRNKEDLLRSLHSELEQIKTLLVGEGNLLYPEIWDSIISSGQIMLLDSGQVTKLSNLYRFIKGTEYEARRVRDLAEDFRRTPSDELKRLWISYSETEMKREEDLRKMIEEILQEKWWDY